MPLIDITNYILHEQGTWLNPPGPQFTINDTKTPGRLMLRWIGDSVTLGGPLRIRVTFQSENVLFGAGTPITTDFASPDLEVDFTIPPTGLQTATIYTYVLDVPAGQAWPFEFKDGTIFQRLGTNFGYRVLIEPAVGTPQAVATPGADLPCDFAVGDIPDSAKFFPAACEPCDGAVSVGVPPGGPTLAIPAADGGCVRTRYFNGMFITKEDLETDQRYFRIKSRLHNRAIGEGVVWGLNVGKQGNQICVSPGYALDCCGNDLAVTTLYKVDITTLLRDPAAAAALAVGGKRQGGVRMHLLLEYLECPSDPRPVHADPCGGSAQRCETSRIRETVRLRLVPPRDVDTSGPLQTFLDQVKALRGKYPLPPGLPVPDTAPPQAPFVVRFTATGTLGDGSTTELTSEYRPGGGGPDVGVFEDMTGITEVRISIEFDPIHVFTDGHVLARRDAPSTVIYKDEDIQLDDFDFNSAEATFTRTAGSRETFTYELQDWVAQFAFAPEDSLVYRGSESLTFEIDESGALTRIDFENAPVTHDRSGVDPASCGGEPCLPAGAPPVLPQLPWLHDDPVHPDRAGDVKALLLASVGSWLMQLLARSRAGTQTEVWTTRRLLASAMYQMMWLLFYGVDQGPGRADILESLRKLFQGWCESFLYKGPQCRGEPHGAVIGCAIVSAGGMSDIDPYGGRRWVVQYPLVTHWMSRFGIAPLDVMASRMFSTICCVAELPSFSQLPEVPPLVIEVGSCFVTFGTPAKIRDELLSTEGLTVTEMRTLTFAEMVAKLIEAIGSRGPEPAPGEEPPPPTQAIGYTWGSPMAPSILSIICPIALSGDPGSSPRPSPPIPPEPIVRPAPPRPVPPVPPVRPVTPVRPVEPEELAILRGRVRDAMAELESTRDAAEVRVLAPALINLLKNLRLLPALADLRREIDDLVSELETGGTDLMELKPRIQEILDKARQRLDAIS